MGAPEVTEAAPRPVRRLRRRVRLRRLSRRLLAAAAGALLAWSCPHWPQEARPVCTVLLEIAGVLHEP